MDLLKLAELMKTASAANPVVLKYEESESQGYGYDGASYETTYMRVVGVHEENDNVLLDCEVSIKLCEFHEYMGKVKKSAPTVAYNTQFCATRRYKGLSFVQGDKIPDDVIKSVTDHLKRKKDDAVQNYNLWVTRKATL